MAAFEYVALDPAGKTRKGVLESESLRQARQSLREKGWVPLEMEAASSNSAKNVSTRPGVRIGNRDLVLITRQLATLVASGLPVDESIKAAAEQSDNRKAVRLLLNIRARVLEGQSLAEAIGEYPMVFPKVYSSTVAAGEHSGRLDIILERLADYIETVYESRQKVLLALLYPCILLILAVLVVLGLLAYVVPKIVTVFVNTGQDLPLLTRSLISISEFLAANYPYILALMILVYLAAKVAFFYEVVKLKVDRTKLKLPIYGNIVRNLDTARFSSTLGILSASGTSLVDAMRVAVEVVENRHLKARIKTAIKSVIEGTSLRVSLGRSECFPPMMLHMIGSGEASGDLDKMLNKTASSQQREIEARIAILIKLIEPLILVVMGGVVMLIVLAILLPIMNMNRLVL